jgi:protein TilB
VEELDEQGNVICEDAEDSDEEDAPAEEDDGLTENTPEARQEIYRELAQQKKEKEDRENANKPRERDYEAEQAAAIEATRLKEEEAGEREVRQKNEGGWDFRWDEESRPGNIVLEVSVARHLDSSLIDVDVHPQYVSMVIKSKVLRLRTPAEVKAGESKCQRSKTTGALLVIMPKVNPRETTIAPAATIKAAKTAQAERARGGPASSSAAAASASKPAPTKKLSLQEQMMQLALAEQAAASASASASAPLSAAVDVKNIVKRKDKDGDGESVFALESAQGQGQGKTLVSEID